MVTKPIKHMNTHTYIMFHKLGVQVGSDTKGGWSRAVSWASQKKKKKTVDEAEMGRKANQSTLGRINVMPLWTLRWWDDVGQRNVGLTHSPVWSGIMKSKSFILFYPVFLWSSDGHLWSWLSFLATECFFPLCKWISKTSNLICTLL